MKKNLLALTVAALVAASSSVAVAAVPDTFYAGFRAGYAHADWDSPADTDYWTDGDTAGYGLGVYGGYSFNEYIGLELGYNFWDGFEADEQYPAPNTSAETKDIRVHGPEVTARLSLPLSDNGSDVFLRGGAMYAFASGSSDKLAPVVGAGFNFMMTDNLSLRVGYDRYFSVYDDDKETSGIDFDVDLAYLSLAYVFGNRTPAPAPVPVQQTVTTTTTYNLDANTTFGFDSANLSQDGRDAISQVVLDAQNANLTDAQYSVTGYTDRLGNPAYNQKLSERRAQAVADELMAKGVPAGSISTVGMGSADSVTGTQCDGLSRSEAIKCLAPDRRVVVNVTGTTTVETTETAPL